MNLLWNNINDLKGFCENPHVSCSFLAGLHRIQLCNEKVDHKAKADANALTSVLYKVLLSLLGNILKQPVESS